MADIARQTGAPADAADCVRDTQAPPLRPRARGVAAGNRPPPGGGRRGHEHEIVALWERKKHLLHRIETLTQGIS